MLGHVLVPRFVFPIYLSYHQLGVTSYVVFYENMKIARSISARVASYSASLLDVGKSNRIACSILSLIGALSCKPTDELKSHLFLVYFSASFYSKKD